MKVKFSLIPFIPVAIAMVALKLMSLFGIDRDGLVLDMNKMDVAFVVIGLSLALFIVCILINIFDRKTAPVYVVSKNPIAGLLCILSGIAIAGASCLSLVNNTADSENYIISILCAIISIPAAIALILMCRIHFTGKTDISGLSFLYIFPALWSCAELVFEFFNATKVSIYSTDMTPLFCYVFLTLYLFSHSMIISRIKGRNPVKACFIYGLPAIAVSLTYGLYAVCTSAFEGFDILQMLVGGQFVLLALYALSFIVEMFFGTMTNDEVEIIDGMPNDNEGTDESYIRKAGELDGFIMGYDTDNEDEPISYLTKEEIKNSDALNRVFFQTNHNEPEENFETVSENMKESVDDVMQTEAKPVETVNLQTETKSYNSAVPQRKADKKITLDSVAVEDDGISDIDRLLQELENKK